MKGSLRLTYLPALGNTSRFKSKRSRLGRSDSSSVAMRASNITRMSCSNSKVMSSPRYLVETAHSQASVQGVAGSHMILLERRSAYSGTRKATASPSTRSPRKSCRGCTLTTPSPGAMRGIDTLSHTYSVCEHTDEIFAARPLETVSKKEAIIPRARA